MGSVFEEVSDAQFVCYPTQKGTEGKIMTEKQAGILKVTSALTAGV